MLYNNAAMAMSSSSLAGMDAEMDEDDAEYLEQGVKDDSCLGPDTPDLTSEKKLHEKSRNNLTSIDSESGSIEESCEGRLCSKNKQSFSNSNDEFSLLPGAVTANENSEERSLSNSSTEYFFKDRSKLEFDLNENTRNKWIHANEAERITQVETPTNAKSQTGCISSESLTTISGKPNHACQTEGKRQSPSQPTFEMQERNSMNSFQDSPEHQESTNGLQIITEGVEVKFNKLDLQNDGIRSPIIVPSKPCMPKSKSMDRLLIEAAQFAEAVGEIPPSNLDEISRRIIDVDEDDDDDSDGGSTEMTKEEISKTSEGKKDTREQRENSSFRHLSSSVDDSILPINNKSNMLESNPRRERSKSMDEKEIKDDNQSLSMMPSTREWKNMNSSNEINNLQPFHAKLFESLSRKKALHEKSLLDGLTPLEGTHCSREDSSSYVYRGLKSNPPAITQRGISRGNYAQLHRKAWLEVSDKYHRYGKNLRLYYKHWESLNHPTNMFFDWLDCKGEAAGQPLPNLKECPRSQLDSDTVLYITNPDITARYELSIETSPNTGMYIADAEGNPIDTGFEGWIFVLRDSLLYAAPKVTSVSGKSKQRFHHSSFFGGKAVAAAGIIITDKNGVLQRLYPHSGHYRPGEAHMHRMLFFLQKRGIDLFSFQVDTQQIMHVSRKERNNSTPKGGKGDDMSSNVKSSIVKASGTKTKKVNNLHLRSGATVACLLAHKAHMIGHGVFAQIHKIRRAKQPIHVRSVLKQMGEG